MGWALRVDVATLADVSVYVGVELCQFAQRGIALHLPSIGELGRTNFICLSDGISAGGNTRLCAQGPAAIGSHGGDTKPASASVTQTNGHHAS